MYSSSSNFGMAQGTGGMNRAFELLQAWGFVMSLLLDDLEDLISVVVW